MLRLLAVVSMATCLVTSAALRAQTAAAQPAAAAAKPAKKPAKTPKAAKPAAPSAAESGPCDMGVIVSAGDVFTIEKVGFTIFNTQRDRIPISWGLDDLIFARIKSIGGAGVRRIAATGEAIEAYNHPKAFWQQGDSPGDVIRRVAGPIECRRYLVITRQTGQLPNTNMAITGIGVVQHSIFGYTSVFALIKLDLLDGRSFELQRNPNDNFKRVFSDAAENFGGARGMQKIDNSAYPDAPSDAANSALLRDTARALLTARLDKDIPAYFAQGEQ
jgi:hypothetical protein